MRLTKCKQCKVLPTEKVKKLAEYYATIYLYYCPQCGISTDVYWSLEEARKAWNTKVRSYETY